MVKIPSLDDLKKMGSDLMTSAKNIKMDNVVEKIKTQVETVSAKFNTLSGAKGSLDRINAGLNELLQSQPHRADAIKKIQAEVALLQKAVEAELAEKAAAEAQTKPTETKSEDKDSENK